MRKPYVQKSVLREECDDRMSGILFSYVQKALLPDYECDISRSRMARQVFIQWTYTNKGLVSERARVPSNPPILADDHRHFLH